MKIWKRLQDMTGTQFLVVLVVGICVIMAAFIVEGILGANADTTPEETTNMHWSEFPGAAEYDLVPAPDGPAELYPPTIPEQDRLDPKLPADGPTDMIAPSSFCEDGPTGRVDHEGNCVDDIVMPVDPERHMNIPPVDSWNQELNTEFIPDPDFN